MSFCIPFLLNYFSYLFLPDATPGLWQVQNAWTTLREECVGLPQFSHQSFYYNSLLISTLVVYLEALCERKPILSLSEND